MSDVSVKHFEQSFDTSTMNWFMMLLHLSAGIKSSLSSSSRVLFHPSAPPTLTDQTQNQYRESRVCTPSTRSSAGVALNTTASFTVSNNCTKGSCCSKAVTLPLTLVLFIHLQLFMQLQTHTSAKTWKIWWTANHVGCTATCILCRQVLYMK